MTQLRAVITDRSGKPVARLEEFEELEAVLPLNDARTGKLMLNMGDPAVKQVMPGKRMVKMIYGDHLVHWGVMMKPVFDFERGSVEVPTHSWSALAAKQCFHRYGDIVVDSKYPVDGDGMRRLLESVPPQVEQQLAGCLPAGFFWGIDDTIAQGPPPVDPKNPEPGDGWWRRVRRGTNVWESMVNLTQIGRIEDEEGNVVFAGLDFDFRPVDAEHPGESSAGQFDGYYEEFDVWNRRGEDRSDHVVFRYGFADNTADNIVFEPDFSVVRNYWVQVNPGGQRSTADQNRGISQVFDSWAEYGIMQGWESSGQKDTVDVLESRARAWTQAYSYPPEFFSVAPAEDRPGVPRFLDDYGVGDVIRAEAKRGYVDFAGRGRVIKATIRQVGAGRTRVDLECVPYIDADLTTDDPG